MWYLDAARYLAPVAVWLLALRTVLLLFRSQLDSAWARRSRGHVVVCGLGRRGDRLARLLRIQGRRVVAVESDPLSPGIASCRSEGVLVVVGDATDPRILAQGGHTLG